MPKNETLKIRGKEIAKFIKIFSSSVEEKTKEEKEEEEKGVLVQEKPKRGIGLENSIRSLSLCLHSFFVVYIETALNVRVHTHTHTKKKKKKKKKKKNTFFCRFYIISCYTNVLRRKNKRR